MKSYYILLLTCFVLVSSNVYSQERIGNWCSSDDATTKYREIDPEGTRNALLSFDSAIVNFNNSASKNEFRGTYIIPIVFHVITAPGATPISTTLIDALIDRLNIDYGRTNSDTTIVQAPYRNLIGRANMRFARAAFDQHDQPTDGIVYIESAKTDLSKLATRDDVKYLSSWPSKRYLNIWIVDKIGTQTGAISGEVLGYATFPDYVVAGITRESEDGVVLKKSVVNKVDRTATHEIGHYLGLRHPFQGEDQEDGCSTGPCKFMGDGICDIPQATTANFGCPKGVNSCPLDGGVDNVTNFMDYADCQAMFSKEQVQRMRATCATIRTELVSWQNVGRVLGVHDGPITQKEELQVYPNPFTKQITLGLKTPEGDKACIDIKDLLGRSVYKNCNKNFSSATSTIELGMEEMGLTQTGIYIIEVTVNDQTYTQKVSFIGQ